MYKTAIATVLCLTLVGCQQTVPVRETPAAVDPGPHTVSAPSQSTAPVRASQQQPSTSPVITLHLAQQRNEEGLIEVMLGEDFLFALPQPVLTQGDMTRVSPLTTQEGGTFLLFQFNERGTELLRNVTTQARGHFFLLSVNGDLVSVAQIADEIDDGQLLIVTDGPEHTQAILQRMQAQ